MTPPESQATDFTLRPSTPADARDLGRICFEAFGAVGRRYGFPSAFPSVDATAAMLARMLAHPDYFSLLAERDGRILGSIVLDQRGEIGAIGPITVDPDTQDRGVGRLLMQAALDHAAERKLAGVRLVVAAHHPRAFALYADLGFQVREALACIQGAPLGVVSPGRTVRPMQASDLAACDRLCRRVHGHARSGEVRDSLRAGTGLVVEHDGRITGYASAMAFTGHGLGETDDDLKALIGAAPSFGGQGILLTARSPLLGWCLSHKLRVVQTMLLMSVGLYNEPTGAFFPSVFS